VTQRVRGEPAVGVHGAGVPDRAEHRQVVGRIGVGRARREVEPLALGEGADGVGLRRSVQRLSLQPSGVEAVDHLGHRADPTGETEASGDQAGELVR